MYKFDGNYTQEQVDAMNKQRLQEACAACNDATEIYNCPCQSCNEKSDEACVDCPCDHSKCKWMVE